MPEHENTRFKLLPSSRTQRILIGIASLLIIGSVAYAAAPNMFNPGDPLSSSKLNANFSALDGRIAALETAVVVPPGTVVPYAGSTVPSGWLLCDGRAVNRTQFAALFAAISVAHGVGDSVTTFNLPDYRGRFLRGTVMGAGRDPDRTSRISASSGGNAGDNVGSVQNAATARPTTTAFVTNSAGDHNHMAPTTSATGGGSVEVPTATSNGFDYIPSIPTSNAGAHTHSISSGGDSETRPINANVNYIIKS